MKNCEKYKELFPEALYNELDSEESKEFHEHLRQCKECLREYNEMKSTIDLFDQKDRPDPGEDFWDNYWENLSGRLEQEEKSEPVKKQPVFVNLNLRWAYRAAAAIIFVLIGVYIGKLYYKQPSQFPVTMNPNENELFHQTAVVEERSERYLERAKLLLLGIVNYEADQYDSSSPDLTIQQELSQDLLKEAAVLKKDLKKTKQRRLRELINELELILLQIANLEKDYDMQSVEMLQNGVEQKGLLFKINLEEMRKTAGEKYKPQKRKKVQI